MTAFGDERLAQDRLTYIRQEISGRSEAGPNRSPGEARANYGFSKIQSLGLIAE
ncbi:hypothetical protein V8J82_09420 [Gymnodinialimonas sp. 2305UL16-5]|uniref:hypothetical protein n=1 Tax=Gymnodinialimonas mytili TaxID=3126503 RepID=UPI0030A30E04